MKIIFDATAMIVNKTGVAYYIERLALQLSKSFPQDEFIGFYYNFLGKRDASHLPRRKNLRYTKASLIPSKIVFQLRRWGIEFPVESLSTTRGDFVLFANFLGYPSLCHTPSAMVIHDLAYIDLPEYVSAKLRRDLTRFVPKQIKRSSFIVTVSEFSKQRIIDTYHPDVPVVVTPIPPEDPTWYSDDDRQKTLQKFGITKPFLLFLGTIEPRKNIISLIDAYEQLPAKQRANYQLVIAGRIGWNCDAEKQRLKQLKNEHNTNIVHVGYVTDQERAILFQTAEYFVHASHYEGFGMPLLEAMSYGTPCVVSDIQVFHEVAGSAATYFPHQNPKDIAQKLVPLLNNPKKRAELSKQATVRADSFTWEAVATNVHEQITKAVASHTDQ
jgi:glycosyltransferase involved in cell wall biosynthesis